jgi:hypothetical protein
MTQNHQPDPEFVSNLEWQVRTALRREHRFSEPVSSRSRGTMQIAALVLVSALLGAGGVVVKDEVQEARRQEILLAEVAANQRIAAMELELLRARAEETQRLFDEEFASREAVQNALLQVREAEIRFTKLTLDEEEIRLTGREPLNELSAPLVSGRDFVNERLALEASVVNERREIAREAHARAQELYRDGFAGQEAVSRARAEVDRLDAVIVEMSSRLALRQIVLEGGLSGQEAENEVELRRIRMELAALVQLRDDAVSRVRRAEELVVQGLAGESHLREVRLELMQLNTRLELLQLKLEVLMGGGVR